ncbi:hypothetical protein SODALDRAFT_359955 [Sodiomyces alkalinus F11]|uniref:Proteophosphoglycan 5 n=1 Tax=Sodiomyces alkalinus (strain CBS 110278 / VKM F-3762 / F11) TaxID=1314773 RepID=A0A3N2PWG7_SODAK|nr:hypothetical protein SODALDRAFT_359955 [Sodiomyces alkalinus F11]ROT38832.1 hypothetical protein SODALDRAFT_359955 [Sodiomyces alkalinus F11]
MYHMVWLCPPAFPATPSSFLVTFALDTTDTQDAPSVLRSKRFARSRMQKITTQEKPTPPRGRQGRRASRSVGQKVYASENDATGPTATTVSQASQLLTPKTPFSEALDLSSTTESSTTSKSRPRNKNHPKNTVASPDIPQTSRRTPPHSASATKSSSASAFAGATFHASPAPSALPLPSFLKTHTGSPRPQDGGQQQPSPPTTEADAPTPTPSRLSVGLSRHESPLEAIFRADRAEKERARRASFSTLLADQGPASPPNSFPRDLPSIAGYRSDPRARPQPYRSTSGIPLSELDGTPDRRVGPAFATPYQERIRLARAAAQPSPERSLCPPREEDPSDALKRYLFGSKPGSTNAPRPKQDSTDTPSPLPEARPSNKPVVGSSVSAERPPGLLAMEDDLRRILKLT